MFRASLPEDGGMLFDFHEERPVAMWMKNTPLSLDMIFVARDGQVVSLALGAEPFRSGSSPPARRRGGDRAGRRHGASACRSRSAISVRHPIFKR